MGTLKRGLLCQLLVVVGVLASACGANSSSDQRNAVLDPGQCRTVTDCDGSQSCIATADPAPTATQRLAVAVVAPCPNIPCNTDDQCAGMVCQSNQGTLAPPFPSCFGTSFCAPACTETNCAPGWACATDGHCTVIPCTASSFAGCPTGWYCDETATATGIDPTQGFSGLAIDGSDSAGADLTVIEAGCRQLRCDEPDGPQCTAGWVCDVAGAAPNSVGCRALPCGEYGACSDDSLYICVPTSSNPRYAGMDPHGCVLKNCEEGRACSTYQTCDFTRADADMSGCSFVKCDEPSGTCPTVGNVCDPSNPIADVYGCRFPNCREGQVCAANAHCEPTDPLADSYGCVTPAPTDPVITPNPPPPLSALGGSCSVDANCQQGYCVQGTCHASPGQCMGI